MMGNDMLRVKRLSRIYATFSGSSLALHQLTVFGVASPEEKPALWRGFVLQIFADQA